MNTVTRLQLPYPARILNRRDAFPAREAAILLGSFYDSDEV